jgi:very-short-patch-repair endonuclease
MVVVFHTGPLTYVQRRWVAALHAGPRSVVAGLTTLEDLGLRGWGDDDAHVLVPPGVHVPRLAGVVAHMTRHLHPDDIGSRGGLLSTTAARSALDAARWQGSSRRASGLILAVVQQRLVRPDELRACLDRLGRITHRSHIAAAIAESAGGADSFAEVEVGRLVVRAGLPRPRRQVVIETPQGLRRVDLVVDLPDGRLLVIEVDGIHHLTPDVRLADALKDAAIIAGGDQVLRIPVTALRLQKDVLLRQLIAIRQAAERRTRLSGQDR